MQVGMVVKALGKQMDRNPVDDKQIVETLTFLKQMVDGIIDLPTAPVEAPVTDAEIAEVEAHANGLLTKGEGNWTASLAHSGDIPPMVARPLDAFVPADEPIVTEIDTINTDADDEF